MAIPRLTWKSGENLKKLRPEFSTDLLNLPAIHHVSNARQYR